MVLARHQVVVQLPRFWLDFDATLAKLILNLLEMPSSLTATPKIGIQLHHLAVNILATRIIADGTRQQR